MRFRHFRRALVVAAAVALAACGEAPTSPAPARVVASAEQDNIPPIRFEISGAQWIPCANGGAGEWLATTGTIHYRATVLRTAAGSERFTLHANASGLQGVGRQTGEVFQGSLVDRGIAGTDATGAGEARLHERVRFVGRGGAVNFDLEYVGRVQQDADGFLHVIVDEVRTSCGA